MRVKSKEEIKAAYRTITDAGEMLPANAFTPDGLCRLEGAADALNWALNDDELASIFETALRALRLRLEKRRGRP